MKKPTTQTIRVTPKLATEWLERNTNNRPVKDSTVREYAAQMSAGKWMLNGEAVIFDVNEVLVDGQHRLWACIESNTPFETVVVTGVEEGSFATIDTGVKRTASDILHIGGHGKYAATMASAATLIINYQRKSIGKKGVLPKQDILNFVDNNSDLEKWVSAAKRTRSWTTTYAAPLSALLFLGSKKYPTKAEFFLEKFVSGMDLPAGSPILALRNRLGCEKRLSKEERFALFALAWNAHVQDRKLNKMQSPRSDEFPKIAGA